MDSTSSDNSHLLTGLYKIMDEIQLAGETESQGLARLQYLVESIKKLVPSIQTVGAAAHSSIKENNSSAFQDYLICYEWADCAKSFLILYQDVLFQEQKAWQQVSSKVTDLANFRLLQTQSNEVLREAHAEFKYFLEQERSTTPNVSKRLNQWKLQTNPWPIYRKQINVFPQQAEDLLSQCEQIWNASGVFVVIYSQIMDNFREAISQIDQLQIDIQDLIGQVEKERKYPLKNVISRLDTLYHQMISTGSGIDSFNEGVEEHLAKLPESTKIFVDTEGGMVYYKDVELQKQTRSWLESEVMSSMYELYAIKESIQNKINLTKVNLSNRMSAGIEDQEEMNTDNILVALQIFLKSLEKSRHKVLGLETQVGQNLKSEFDLNGIYKDSFLPVSMQYTIKQYQQGERLKFVNDWLSKQGRMLSQFRQSVREEGALSISEKIVRVVKGRTFQPENSHYTNMFLTKGYIGDSFWVGRKEELAHIASVVENWRLGFRGSMMITGKRFAGKTLLGELVSQKHFINQTIRLKPESKIQIAGRHFDCSYDLKTALNFVVKNTINQPMMIWIDDLELWENDKISLGDNINSLLHTIDQFTGRLFFVVAMSNWVEDHLHKIFEIKKVFQSAVNVDRMKLEEVQQAILTRHSATHMELVDNDEKEEINPSELLKKINQIYRSTNGNIGEALQSWAYTVQKYDEEKVMLKEELNFTLPSFLSADSSILLRAIMMEKRTNEYRLRKQFGPAFNDKYKVVLQRMSSLGVVRRSLNGWLEINPILVNDIGLQLDRFLNFGFQSKTLLVEDLRL